MLDYNNDYVLPNPPSIHRSYLSQQGMCPMLFNEVHKILLILTAAPQYPRAKDICEHSKHILLIQLSLDQIMLVCLKAKALDYK